MEGTTLRFTSKIAPLAFLTILCLIPIVAAGAVAPQPTSPSYRFTGATRTIGPSPSWSRLYGGASNEYMYDMIQCSSGGFAIVGYTYSFGGNAEVYLVRTDADGTMLWNKTYGGPNYDYSRGVVECSDGGFAIAAYSNSWTPSYDCWLIRTDANGNHLWNTTYGGSSTEYAMGLVVDADDNITMVGSTYSFGPGSSDYWLVHTNSTGGHLWNQTYGGGAWDYAYDVVACSDGGYAICGESMSFGEGTSAWVVRTDAAGNHLWNQTYDGSSFETAWSLIECTSGGFAIAGHTTSYGASFQAAWLIRTDASGNHLWNQTYDEPWDDRAYAVIEYSEGGFILAGMTGLYDDRGGGDDSDSLLIRTDASGTMLWNRSYGGESYDDYYYAVVEGANGDLVAAGYTRSFGVASYEGWLTKTAYPLAFSPALADQSVPFNTPLAYNINVSTWFGEDTWTINDTIHFTISSAGIVSNVLVLGTGVYGLRVSVNDTLAHEISGEFSVVITPREFFPIPIALILGLALIAIIIVILVYIYLSRKD